MGLIFSDERILRELDRLQRAVARVELALGEMQLTASRVDVKLTQVLKNQGAFAMAIGQETRKVIDALNAATNDIAARIDRIVAGSDLTDEEKEKFSEVTARLHALASDPENPVPEG